MTETERKLMELERELEAISQREKSNSHRINSLEEETKENRSLIVAIEKLATEMKSMHESLDQTILRLNQLEKDSVNEDADKWKKFTWYIFITIVGCILGTIATKLGLN